MSLEELHSLFHQMNVGDSEENSHAVKILENWYSSLIFLDNAVEIISHTDDQDFLTFVASLLCRKIEYIHESIQEEFITVTFQNILERLQNAENSLNETPRVLLIRIISAISLLWPDFSANWESLINETPHDISVFLVEYIRHPLFAYYLEDLDRGLILEISLNTLKNQSPYDVYWIQLLDASLYLTPEVNIFEQFFENLIESTKNVDSIPFIITYIENLLAAECIDEESENDFYSQIIAIAVQLADQLFQPETFMQSSSLLSTVISFMPSFYANEQNENFTKEVLKQYIGAMNAFLSQETEETNEEFRSMCDSISVLFTGLPDFDRTAIFENEIIETIKLMCNYINSIDNYNYQKEPQFFYAFKLILSLDCFESLKNLLEEMYASMISGGVPNQALFYSAALNPLSVQHFAVLLIKFIIDNHVVLISSIYFLSAAAKYANDLRSDIIFFIFTELDSDPQLLSNAILSMAVHYTYLFYDNADQLIIPLIEKIAENIATNVKCNIILTILISLPKVECTDDVKTEILTTIGQNIANTIDELTSEISDYSELKENVIEIYRFTHKLMSTIPIVYPSILPYYSDLFHTYFSIIEEHIDQSIWSCHSDEIQETLCMIVEDAIKYNWSNEPQQYIDWISSVIYVAPVPKHFDILAKYVYESQPSSILLFVQSFDQNDTDVQVMIINYIAKIAQTDINLLFQIFPDEFLLSPLISDIPNVVSAGLDFILVLIKLPIDESFYSYTAETIISRIDKYGVSQIDQAMYVLVYLSQKFELMDHILSLFHQKIGEGPLQSQFIIIFTKTVKGEIICKEATMTPLNEITRSVLQLLNENIES